MNFQAWETSRQIYKYEAMVWSTEKIIYNVYLYVYTQAYVKKTRLRLGARVTLYLYVFYIADVSEINDTGTRNGGE